MYLTGESPACVAHARHSALISSCKPSYADPSEKTKEMVASRWKTTLMMTMPSELRIPAAAFAMPQTP